MMLFHGNQQVDRSCYTKYVCYKRFGISCQDREITHNHQGMSDHKVYVKVFLRQQLKMLFSGSQLVDRSRNTEYVC